MPFLPCRKAAIQAALLSRLARIVLFLLVKAKQNYSPITGWFTRYGQRGNFIRIYAALFIEFIHLRDLKNLIASAAQQVRNMEKVARSMQQIIELEAHLNRQFQLVK